MTKIRTSRLSLLKLPHNVRSERDFLGRYWLIKDESTVYPRAPRAWEVELEQLLNGLTDPVLIARIRAILELAKLGWLDQNGSSEVHETVGQAESVLNNQNARPDFVNMPNNQPLKPTNSIGPNTSSLVAPRVPSNRNVSTMRDSLTNPSASFDPNTQNPQIANYRRKVKHYRGSLFQKAPKPSFLFKNYKCTGTLCKQLDKTSITFSPTNNLLDSDGDKFSRNNLEMWSRQINNGGLPLTVNHGKDVIADEIGVLRSSQVNCKSDGSCELVVSADLFPNNSTANELIERTKLGRALEFSISAIPNTKNPDWSHKEGDTRVIDDSSLTDISVVRTGSNRFTRLLSVND